MKELIINADDFGLSAGANRAVIRAWHEGILTGASLMVGEGVSTRRYPWPGRTRGCRSACT